jgi:predicted nuclease of predicted toxin-antitoxin system
VKIKLDENMLATLAAILTAYGHDTDTVHEEGLTGKSDHDVWRRDYG